MFHPHVLLNAIDHAIEELVEQARAEAPQTRLDAIVNALEDMQNNLKEAKDAWALEDTDDEIAAYQASQTAAPDDGSVEVPLEDRVSHHADATPEYEDLTEFRVYRRHSLCGIGLCQGTEIVLYIGDRDRIDGVTGTFRAHLAFALADHRTAFADTRTQYTVITKQSTFTRRYVVITGSPAHQYRFFTELTASDDQAAYEQAEQLTSPRWPMCELRRDGAHLATYTDGRWQ